MTTTPGRNRSGRANDPRLHHRLSLRRDAVLHRDVCVPANGAAAASLRLEDGRDHDGAWAFLELDDSEAAEWDQALATEALRLAFEEGTTG